MSGQFYFSVVLLHNCAYKLLMKNLSFIVSFYQESFDQKFVFAIILFVSTQYSRQFFFRKNVMLTNWEKVKQKTLIE